MPCGYCAVLMALPKSTSPRKTWCATVWSSSDTSLATVDEYGNVKNVNQGTEKQKAVITASVGSVTVTCDVHCKPANTLKS